MNCLELNKILDLTDAHQRVRREALSQHLHSCLACREAHPELGLLLRSDVHADVERLPRFQPPRRLALPHVVPLAAAILALVWFQFGSQRSPQDRVPSDARARHLEQPRAMVSGGVLETRLVSIQRGRRVASIFTRTVWTPPPPRCLQALDHGS